MDPYGPSHLAALAVLVAGLPVAVLLGRRERRAGDDRLSRAFALAIPLVFVPTQVVELATRWDLGVSVPLHLCDLAWVAAALALWTQDRRVVTLTYLWSPLTLQAVLTPSLGEDFPDLRYLAYWVLHLLILWAAAFLVGGLGLNPGLARVPVRGRGDRGVGRDGGRVQRRVRHQLRLPRAQAGQRLRARPARALARLPGGRGRGRADRLDHYDGGPGRVAA